MSCPGCFKGTVHEGTPRGHIAKVYGVDTYISEPAEGQAAKGIIVIIPDAFGLPFVNTQLLADRYAEKGGYRAYLPNFMNGYPAPAWMLDSVRVVDRPGNSLGRLYHMPMVAYAIVPWFYHNRIGASYPRVKAFFTALSNDPAAAGLPIGAAGFCWGGKHVVLLAAEKPAAGTDKPLITAGFTGHPSLLDVPADIPRMRRPVSFAIGDADTYLSVAEVNKIKAKVETFPEEYRGEARLYEGCGHGFCLRADTRYDSAAKQAEKAEEQCLQWFDRWFGVQGLK